MDAKDLELKLKSVLAGNDYTLTKLVRKLNEQGNTTTIQNLSNKLKRGTINYLEIEEILNAIGYSIEWIQK